MALFSSRGSKLGSGFSHLEVENIELFNKVGLKTLTGNIFEVHVPLPPGEINNDMILQGANQTWATNALPKLT